MDDDYEQPGLTPAEELPLWREWVCVVCDWNKMAHPGQDEWAKLKAEWYPGKTPLGSALDLAKHRGLCLTNFKG